MLGKSTPVAVVLINLGTPEELSTTAVRRFLRQFLSDKRVVEIPKPIWWLILNLFVLTFRPRKIVKTYRQVWMDAGSPLRVITEQQVVALQSWLDQRLGTNSPRVLHAMTYGQPAIGRVLKELQAEGYRRLIILPLFPQYSGSTTGAVVDQVANYLRKQRYAPSTNFIGAYFFERSYISALTSSIRDFWSREGRAEYLLFSYHGIPASYVKKGDPYSGHCECTTGAVIEGLGLESSEYGMSYQSRFGKAEWVRPYTSDTLVALAERGVKTVDVICPAFAADCIETLEEIAIENAHLFRAAGGETLRLIPCLNASAAHIEAFGAILMPHITALSPNLRND